jgi:hypothetical protein
MTSIRITDQLSAGYFELLSSRREIFELDGWEYPDVKTVIDEVAGKQSGVYITSKHAPRVFSFKGIKTMSLAQRRSTLLQVLRQRGSIKLLTFTTLDSVNLQAEVEVMKILWPYSNLRIPFLIELKAPDWRFYAQTQQVNNSNSASQSVTNNGNEDTEPVFRINGAGTSFTVTNSTSGESFVITYTLTGSDYIDVDCKNHTILLNGSTSIFSAMTAGDFFSLVPGVNSLAWAKVGGDASTSLRTTFRDAYNGV